MPYLGIIDGEDVVPPEVTDRETVVCPACDEEMSVIPSYERGTSFVSRHFRHQDSECPGESDTHLKWKAIAYSKLENQYPDATLTFEGTVGDRRADVLVEFSSPDESGLGNGICVEVQHKNENKDVEAVTADFLSRGYSVLWLDKNQFVGEGIGQNDVNLERGTWITWWVNQVPTVEEWSGYHECITSTKDRATNPVNVEIALSIDSLTWKTITELGLDDAWLDGVRKRDGDSVPIRYPCVGCHELITRFASTSYSNNASSEKHHSTFTMTIAGSGPCPECGEQNNIKRRSMVMNSKFVQTNCDQPDSGIFNPDTEIYLPCMQCGSAVQFDAQAEAGSGIDYDSLTLKLERSVACDHCESIMKPAYPPEVRILSSKK